LPYPIGHSLFAWTAGTLLRRRSLSIDERGKALWWSLLAVSPDFDFLLAWITHDYDIHRTATHSLITALFVGMLLAIIEFRSFNWKHGLFYGALIGSHGVLDWATTRFNGSGPELFWPITTKRFAFAKWAMPEFSLPGTPPAWHPVLELVEICVVEILVFLPIFLLVTLAFWYWRQRQTTPIRLQNS